MKYRQWIKKPTSLLMILLLIVFSVESLVMYFLLLLPANLSSWEAMILDAGSLTILSAPLIWLLIIRPISQDFKADNEELNKMLVKTKINAEVMKTTGVGILISDAKNRVISVNPGFCALTGLTEKDILGKKPNILHSGKQSKEFYKRMWISILETGSWEGEIYNKRADGSTYLELLRITQVKNSAGEVTNYIGIFQDITAENAYKNNLIKKTYFDSLTGIYNRPTFEEHLKQLLAQSRRNKNQVFVFFMDLDKFKIINDSYGHEVGDKLLQHVANCLKNSFRQNDVVARFGGDEFVMASSHEEGATGNESVTKVLDKIIAIIEKPIQINTHTISAHISIGVSCSPKDSDNIDELIRMADKAMYHAKFDTKSSVVFWGNIHP